MADASTRGWGKGWPANRSKDLAKVLRGDVALWVHHRIAPIVAWLVNETERLSYQLVGKDEGPPAGWCWGYANRAIRGTSRPSNHSWGLAVDLNAPANPMGSELVTDMPASMVELWKAHGFAWGGDYAGRKDAMHFEFVGTPADAERIVERLGAPKLVSRQRPAPQEGGDRVRIDQPPVAILDHPEGGYWEVASDGGVFAFGAPFHGGLGGKPLNAPIVGGAVTPDGGGYWLVAADGGVFAFGDAEFLGSTGSIALNAPIRGMAATRSGRGYRLLGGDGGVFCFGDAEFRGAVEYVAP